MIQRIDIDPQFLTSSPFFPEDTGFSSCLQNGVRFRGEPFDPRAGEKLWPRWGKHFGPARGKHFGPGGGMVLALDTRVY